MKTLFYWGFCKMNLYKLHVHSLSIIKTNKKSIEFTSDLSGLIDIISSAFFEVPPSSTRYFFFVFCHDGLDHLYHRRIQHANHGLFKLNPSKKAFKILCSKAHKWLVGFRVLALKSFLQMYITLYIHNRCFESRYCRKKLQKIFQ